MTCPQNPQKTVVPDKTTRYIPLALKDEYQIICFEGILSVDSFFSPMLVLETCQLSIHILISTITIRTGV